jgi:hypothetical protein
MGAAASRKAPVIAHAALARLMLMPTCAVCGKTVEVFDTLDDSFMERVRFTARCHGETESVDIPYSQLGQSVRFGQAFTSSTRRLPPCP